MMWTSVVTTAITITTPKPTITAKRSARHLLDLISRGALYALLLWAPLASGGYRGWFLATVQLLTLLGLVTWIVGMLVEHRLAWRRTALDLPLVLVVVLVVVQLALGNRPLASWALAAPPASLDLPADLPTPLFTLGTVSPAQTARSFLLLLTYAAVYVLVVNLIKERRQLERLVQTVLLFGGMLAFLGLLDYLAGEPGLIGWRDSPQTGRLSGTFVNPDHFAAWLAMLVCLGLGYLATRRRPRGESVSHLLTSRETREHAIRRYLPFVGVGVMALALVFTLSRGGVLSLLLTLVALLALLRALGLTRWSVLLMGALVAVTIAYGAWIGLEPFLARVRTGPLDYVSRGTQSLTTLPMLATFPLFGVGLGAYKDIYFRYQPPALHPGKVYFPYAHNDLLQLVVETGLVGAALVLWAVWRVGRDLVGAHLLGRGRCPVSGDTTPARRQDPFSVGIGLGALGGVLALLVSSVFDFAARIPANGILGAACLGVATVALHTRFGAPAPLLAEVRTRSLGAGWLLPATVGVAVLALSLILVPAIIRPARVEAARSTAVDEALLIDPRDVRALAERAELGSDGARQVWTTGLSPTGEFTVSQADRGRVSLALLDGAIRDLRTALSLMPSDPFLHERLAWIYGTAGVVDSSRSSEYVALAVAHLRRAISLAPENAFLYRSLAALAVTRPEPLVVVGLRAARGAIARDPDLLPDLVDRFLPMGLSEAQWLVFVPEATLDRLALGGALEARRRVREAGAVYRGAAEAASAEEGPFCRWMLARFLLREKDYRGAAAELNAALQRDADNPELHLALADALAGRADPAALDEYRAAVVKAEVMAQKPARDRLPFHLTVPRGRALVAAHLGGSETVTIPRYRTALGLYLNDRELWEQALRVWDAVLTAAPQDPLANFARGVALDGLGAHARALGSYRTAVSLDGGSVRFRLRLAQRLWESDQYYQAIDQWRAVVNQESANVEARLALAQAYRRIGDRDAAAREYQHVLRAAPDHPQARRGLARLRSELPDGERSGKE
jgi:tetratricopeptide (TPR) repeat protein/O-antigen ligase